MDYSAYINNIGFTLYPPMKRAIGFTKLSRLFNTLGLSLEIVNTRLPVRKKYMVSRIGRLCSIPKMSTFALGAMINEGVSRMPPETCFVNIGVWNGFTFLSGMSGNGEKKCIGVDNFSEFGGPRDKFLQRFEGVKSDRHSFYDMDYEEYFKSRHQDPIGFYIYDGEHSYENQLKGLQVAEPFFSDRCIIFVDDTNTEAARKGTEDFIAQSENQYRLILHRDTAYNKHPTFWNGVMVLQRT